MWRRRDSRSTCARDAFFERQRLDLAPSLSSPSPFILDTILIHLTADPHNRLQRGHADHVHEQQAHQELARVAPPEHYVPEASGPYWGEGCVFGVSQIIFWEALRFLVGGQERICALARAFCVSALLEWSGACRRAFASSFGGGGGVGGYLVESAFPAFSLFAFLFPLLHSLLSCGWTRTHLRSCEGVLYCALGVEWSLSSSLCLCLSRWRRSMRIFGRIRLPFLAHPPCSPPRPRLPTFVFTLALFPLLPLTSPPSPPFPPSYLSPLFLHPFPPFFILIPFEKSLADPNAP
jgi:hypothetical protein